MHTMAAVNDRKMHSMACALGRAEHAEPRAIGFCNHQNKFKFHQNTFKSTFQSLPDVEIQFRDKFSLSTFQGEFKNHTFTAMQAYFNAYFSFSFFLSVFISTYILSGVYIYIFLYLQINISNHSQCLKSIRRQLFCVNSSRKIQILQF